MVATWALTHSIKKMSERGRHHQQPDTACVYLRFHVDLQRLNVGLLFFGVVLCGGVAF